MTQDVAREPNGNPAQFLGDVLFYFGGAAVCTVGGDGKMKRNREGGFTLILTVNCTIAV